MKLTKKQVAEIARATKSLRMEGLGNTLHFYLEADGSLSIYEDVSGMESYPGETGVFIMSARYPLTRADVAEEIALREKFESLA